VYYLISVLLSYPGPCKFCICN